MLNRVILIGRLTRDPELRYTPAGVAVTQFTIAVDRPFSSQGGEREADFIPVVTWRQLAETCANYLRKGRLTAVEGRIQVRNYENNEGKRVYVTEVIADNVRFLESNRDSGGSRSDDMGGGYSAPAPNQQQQQFSQPRSGNNSSYNRGPSADPFSDDGKPIDISDDDLPF
ncbi:single-stranded DNA-binding protein [Paenibacillus sp. ACRRX]|uniref:single-stranded DNA-binding protein n=1 Tax=unclassified Paenibacillus TaxID=185978 RepID=UPI001EF4A498|nr:MULTISPECIES: single-stranded DNA-binding protein [unclassified Paenibacillus]MCG7408372.1 single-stranded DNA-binding protein [Paenibacillus sp. ACRRX]MDK8181243.1 single-stranded DNA-binding protein [Paenibacillus sp. UMB4589-SE434]